MDEQEKETVEKTETEAKTETGTTPTEDAGAETKKTVSMMDRADEIAERQKRENDRREKLIERDEALQARRAVGGITDAGQVVEKKEETPKEYNDRIEKEMSEGKHNE